MIRELVELIPPLLTGLSITSTPVKTITTCRLYGSNDATYGTVGWVPPTTGNTFCVIKAKDVNNTFPETNRVWSELRLDVFIGIVHGDTPDVQENYNAEALLWIDAMNQFTASNRRLLPGSLSLSSTLGDVQWIFKSGIIRERHPIFEIPYYGLLCDTSLRVVEGVTYQY